MSYTTAQGRTQLLDQLAHAVDALADALVALGEAYDRLDESSGDRLEQHLFKPVQAAYGAARRSHTAFAARASLPARSFEQAARPLPSDPRQAIERAVTAIGRADDLLAELQDSMLPVEVGDPEIRASLSEIRRSISPLSGVARELSRRVGR
ncbi:MAG: hypothetical protein ACYC91_11330 [Solirubrobacteraceae bacterium]